MAFLRAAVIAALVALISAAANIVAAEPPHPVFVPAPRGVVMKSQLFYPAGEGMQSQWRGVLSREFVGKGSSQPFYQYYLSMYQLDGNTYRLRYRSPDNGGPFSQLAKAHGSELWFPFQNGTIVGAAELMQPGVQQLVVASHQTGADCGSATVSVFGFDSRANKVIPEVSVRNGCELSARIIPSAGNNPASLLLTGPYYNKDAALCCPTKPRASAMLRYQGGRWIQTPRYYEVSIGKIVRY